MDFTECYGDTVSGVAAAARSGCRKRVRRLLKRGCSVDCRDNRGWNALHEAAAAGSKECVQDILSAVGGRTRKESHTNEDCTFVLIFCPLCCVSDDKPHICLIEFTGLLTAAVQRELFKLCCNNDYCLTHFYYSIRTNVEISIQPFHSIL